MVARPQGVDVFLYGERPPVEPAPWLLPKGSVPERCLHLVALRLARALRSSPPPHTDESETTADALSILGMQGRAKQQGLNNTQQRLVRGHCHLVLGGPFCGPGAVVLMVGVKLLRHTGTMTEPRRSSACIECAW